MTPQEAAAVASAIRRHLGADAENFVRKNIRYFQAAPANKAASEAWQEVLVALTMLDALGEPAAC